MQHFFCHFAVIDNIPDDSRTMLIFLDYLGQSTHLKETAMTRNVVNLTGSVTLLSAFFNRWLVVDVPPGWQLVSQVLLALHITLLRGDSLVRVGRECCSVKVHYSSHHMPRPQLRPLHAFWPRTRGISLHLSHPCYHPPPTSPSAFTFPSFYQSSSLFPSLSGGQFQHRRIPLTLPVICP